MKLLVPPYWVRRLITVPAIFLAVTAFLAWIPLGLAVLLLLSWLIPGKWRPLRLAGFALLYAALQWAGLIAAFALWLASGCGWKLRSQWFIDRHYDLLRWALALLVWSARGMFRLRIAAEDDHPAGLVDGRPVLVLSRHAGPGDSFLLVDRLLRKRDRHPRIVLKATLQLDPLIDVLLNRLPCFFVDPTPDHRDASVAAIATLATDMRSRDALVIFPEGGNFTPARRLRAIDRLRGAGREDAAARAERLAFTLPPRPAGVIAARAAAPTAGIAVVAHTGLDTMQTLRDVWRELPMEKTLQADWQWYEPEDVPLDPAGITAWLNDIWTGVDEWVAEHRGAQAADGLAHPEPPR